VLANLVIVNLQYISVDTTILWYIYFNFNITDIIILATCFDSYESSSGLNSRTIVHIVLQFFVLEFWS
jgi:hypothetical protein